LLWLKHHHPEQWDELLGIEARINTATLTQDEEGLRTALEAYRIFFSEDIEGDRWLRGVAALPLATEGGGLRASFPDLMRQRE
jgi:hypothetical protein